MSRAAVMGNPTKLDGDEAFRKSVRQITDDHGWDEPLWLETTPENWTAKSCDRPVSSRSWLSQVPCCCGCRQSQPDT